MSNESMTMPLFVQNTNMDDLNKGSYIHNMYGNADHLRLRSGFGQVYQFDSTLACVSFTNPIEYKKHLGSKLLHTSWGHDQIISVFLVKAYTGSAFSGATAATMGRYGEINLVQIYDLTTDNHWEELLYAYTAQTCKDVSMAHGFYETNIDEQFEQYLNASDKMCFFEQYGDAVIFGNPDLGVFSYQACSFSSRRWQQLDGISQFYDKQNHYSESSVIFPVMPNPGVFGASGDNVGSYQYFTNASFPHVVDAVNLNGRMCYIGNDNLLFFADANFPGSVAAPNYIAIRPRNPLTAVEEINGNLLVFSEEETYLYQPAGTDIISGGALIKLSDTVGCIGPNAVLKARDALIWIDKNGVHLSQNGTSVQDIDKGIKSFWLSDVGISVPFTNYYEAVDASTGAADALPVTYEFDEHDDAIHIAYNAKRDLLFVVNPSLKMSFVLSVAGWHVWSWESVDGRNDDSVLEDSISNPWVSADPDNIYLVGSKESALVEDDTLIRGDAQTPAQEDPINQSFYLLEYGRGGNTDRSIEYELEDGRIVSGKYYGDDDFQEPNTGYRTIIERWKKIQPGYQLFGTAEEANDYTWYLPIELRCAAAGPINQVEINFEFDNTHWTPLFVSDVSTDIAFDLPPERLSTVANYTVNCTNGMEPTRTGNVIHIGFRTVNMIELITNKATNRIPLVYVPMKFKPSLSGAESDCISMGIKFIDAWLMISPGGFETSEFAQIKYTAARYWQQAVLEESRHHDDRGQSIDWCIKTNQINDQRGNQLRLRTAYARLLSHGKAQTNLDLTNQFGQFNMLAASDWKDWTGQVVDITDNIKTIDYKDILRDRMEASGTMVERVFNGNATWGDDTDRTKGNYLIDNEQYDSTALSTSVKGEHVSVMLFGHIRDKAEDLRVNEVAASVRQAGKRRRIGR